MVELLEVALNALESPVFDLDLGSRLRQLLMLVIPALVDTAD